VLLYVGRRLSLPMTLTFDFYLFFTVITIS
jgi:hypothetical protein